MNTALLKINRCILSELIFLIHIERPTVPSNLVAMEGSPISPRRFSTAGVASSDLNIYPDFLKATDSPNSPAVV